MDSIPAPNFPLTNELSSGYNLYNQKLDWKTLEEPGAPWDTNNNKHAFSNDDQKPTFKY